MTSCAMPARALGRFDRRLRRAAQLRARHAFASQWLELYERLLPVQRSACAAALQARPAAHELADYVAARSAPVAVAVAIAHGPPALADALRQQANGARAAVARWLQGEILPPVENFLARAAAAPVLEALAADGIAEGAAGDRGAGDRGAGHCPQCGGLPQVAFTVRSDDALVTAARRLSCARCGSEWSSAQLQCVACGESARDRLHGHADAERLPHLRADACASCRSYVIHVDLRADADAVPEVDELVAAPIDLCMQARGFGKLVPNLMGIGW